MAATQYFEQVQKIFIAFYQRPADPAGLKYWAQRVDAAGGDFAAVIDAFASSTEAVDLYGAIDATTIGTVIDSLYMALFNTAPDAAGKQFYVDGFGAGSFTAGTIALAVLNGAQNDDLIAVNNKVQVANEFTQQVDGRPLTDAYFGTGTGFNVTYQGKGDEDAARLILKGVTFNASTVLNPSQVTEELKTNIADATDPIKGQTGGQTYMLTKGLDNIQGTAGNDTIIGSIDNTGGTELNTLSNLDIINGGAGIDTLKIAHGGSGTTAIELGNLSNVEIISIESANTSGVTVNTTGVTGVTNLNVTKAAAAVSATAGATTDVKVDVKAVGTAAINVVGGKDVAIKVADVAAANNITVGSGTAAKGDVVVEATAKAAVNGTNFTMGTIGVTGGKTISITQKAGDASGLVAGGTTATHTQGAITATANAETTTVTVKQDAAVTAASTLAVAKVDEVATVTFTKLASGESVTVSGLTFQAAKDLTAAQVAQAFANLSATAANPTGSATNVDTNGGNASADGKFTGALLAKWGSAAASGNTVTFTASGAMGTDLAVSGTGATVVTTTQGVDAVTGKNTLGVVAGSVGIVGAAALKTVTVDGFGASSTITGTTNTALDTISLANGAGFTIINAAATLGLTLANVNGTVDVQTGTKTLNAAVSHAKATETTTLVSASAEAVNVSGAGNVAGSTATGGLTAATAINTSAMTGGKATFTIADGTVTTYTGGAGVDTVTVSNANVAMTKAINLGAGDDKLILNVAAGTVAVPTATLDGGTGTNTIALNGASAAALSANGNFAAKIDNFQKLEITDKATAATTINMANMDGIKYVVSKGGDAAAGVTGSKQIFVFDIAGLAMDTSGSGSLKAGDATLFTATAGTAVNATDIATDIGTTATINGVVYTITKAGTQITLTSAANVAPQAGIAVVAAGAGTTPPTSAAVTTTPGVAEVTAGTSYLTIDKMANDGTLDLVDASSGAVVKMADATGSADSFNIVTKVAGDLAFGTVDVAGVETLKLNAVDTTPGTATAPAIDTASLTVKADKATSLMIEGNSHVTLTLDAATTKLATIDASALTGNLQAGNTHAGADTIAMTITGGSGADTLKASVGTTAKADVINGGAGNDTLYAGSNGATLTGGAGNDLFILTAASATTGNKESNTYSTITDFQAGDVLQLQASNTAGSAAIDVTKFGKLAAVLNENTAVFSDFVNAAIKEAGAAEAIYFNYKGDAYVVVDSATDSVGDVFKNGEDLIVKLTGINGDNLSWNSDFATVALV